MNNCNWREAWGHGAFDHPLNPAVSATVSAAVARCIVQVGEEDEEEEETAAAADEEPGLGMQKIPKWKATRITEMLPDASVAELIDAVLRREAEEMAAVIVAAAQKAAQEQLEEELRAAEEACALAAALAAEEEEEEEDDEAKSGSHVAGNSRNTSNKCQLLINYTVEGLHLHNPQRPVA